MKREIYFFLLAALFCLTAAGTQEVCFAQEKEKVSSEKSLRILQNRKADSILRRKAFRMLLKTPHAEKVIASGLHDEDPALRCRSVYEMFRRKGDGAFEAFKKIVKEKDPQTAALLFNCVQQFKDQQKARALTGLLGKHSPLHEIRRKARRITNFPYHKQVRLLRDDPTYDHEVITFKSIPLPRENWKFRPDPEEDGHRRKWFQTGFDDSNWNTIRIGVWEKQGYNDYDGIAWYRLRFTMPEKIPCKGVQIHFGAVDEAAWVWLNGIYAGQHDVGMSGWNKPFDLDITKEIRWGAENLLTVRVEDTKAAGGIWKDVLIHLVK